MLVLVVWCSAEFVQSMLQLRSFCRNLRFLRRWQLTAGRYAQASPLVQDAWKPMQGQGTMCISFGQKPSEMFSSIEMHLLEPIRCLLPRCEFSTPFVAMRWFLDRAGMKSSCLVHVPRNTSTVAD